VPSTRPRRAAVITVGTELLLGIGVDTNTAAIARRLSDLGIVLEESVTVPDVMERISSAVRSVTRRADIVLVTGGLGPTFDDFTREAVAEALGIGIERVPAQVERLLERYGRSEWEVSGLALRQADRLAAAELIEPVRGTAPGQILVHRDKVIVLLPGVPAELAQMLDDTVVGWLEARFGLDSRRRARRLRMTQTSESEVQEKTEECRGAHPDFEFTVLAYPEEVDLVIRPGGPEGLGALDKVTAECEAALGMSVFGRDRHTLEATVVGLLAASDMTCATAESCTGGLIAKRLTDVPGASDVFLGGVVAYSDAAKKDWLSVHGKVLHQYGAVSSPVAAEMASSVRLARRADWGLGVTGIAGPGGATKDKPVGLVYLALAGANGVQTVRKVFGGDRDLVRRRAAQLGLDMLRLAISDHISGRRKS
jgi:nicotinamide-nucleotide amidase